MYVNRAYIGLSGAPGKVSRIEGQFQVGRYQSKGLIQAPEYSSTVHIRAHYMRLVCGGSHPVTIHLNQSLKYPV